MESTSRENATPVISKLNLLAMNTRRVFNLYKPAKTGNIVKRSRIIFFLCNQTFTASWTKSVIVYNLPTEARLKNIKHLAIYCLR